MHHIFSTRHSVALFYRRVMHHLGGFFIPFFTRHGCFAPRVTHPLFTNASTTTKFCVRSIQLLKLVSTLTHTAGQTPPLLTVKLHPSWQSSSFLYLTGFKWSSLYGRIPLNGNPDCRDTKGDKGLYKIVWDGFIYQAGGIFLPPFTAQNYTCLK